MLDKEVALSGALGNDLEKNVIGFDKDDEVTINASLLNKKGYSPFLSLSILLEEKYIKRKESYQ